MSIQLLHSFLQGDCDGSLSWSAVKCIVGDICYGGKITDAQDALSLKALLFEYCYKQFVGEKVNDFLPLKKDDLTA